MHKDGSAFAQNTLQLYRPKRRQRFEVLQFAISGERAREAGDRGERGKSETKKDGKGYERRQYHRGVGTQPVVQIMLYRSLCVIVTP